MVYCYARVSTKAQNIDRQIEAFKSYEPYILVVDKESGKDFERANYQKMKSKIKDGDTLIVLSLDRFGRNYDQIKEEWQYFVNKNVKIKILDMPLLATNSANLAEKVIGNIVLQLLGYVAQMERENNRQRQAEGMRIARDKGVKFGRPRAITPDNTDEILEKYINDELTNIEAAKLIGVSRGTFFKLVKERNLKKHKIGGRKPKVMKRKQINEKELKKLLDQYKNRKISVKEASEKLGVNTKKFYRCIEKANIKKIPKSKSKKPKYRIITFDKVVDCYYIKDIVKQIGVCERTIIRCLNGLHTKLDEWKIKIVVLEEE